MCGIAGFLSQDPRREAPMRRMLDEIRHRGPDGEGILSDGICTLGHRRLSIIDLEGGRQPLANSDGSISLVCNGEIYNYRELRSQLERDGYVFQTHSDCEVIIGLYERHGDDLLRHIRGMFSFGLWDSHRGRLLAARDHLGQKPFYYVDSSDSFAFASEIKSLTAMDPSLRELDLSALEQYFALRLIAPPRSMFAAIRKLPPGHLLIRETGAPARIRRYWNLSYQPKHVGSEQTLLDELESQIEAALELHMVSDVPVGALLSGGLDSSLLVAMLCKKLGVRDLQTFTIGLTYRQFDEAPYARQVAELYGTRHREESLAPSLVDLLPDLLWHLDEPSDPLSLCTFLVSRLASRHVKVVIGGDGGDELFGGYDRYYGNIYADRYARIPSVLRRGLLGPALGLVSTAGWYKSTGHQLRWLHRLSFLSGGQRYAASLNYFYFDPAARSDLFSQESIEKLTGSSPEQDIIQAYEDTSGSALDKMLHADSMIRLPDHPVMITDRMSMAHGLEARSPFMDHQLAEFCARLPAELKVRGRSLRWAQRQLAGRYLPAALLNRPKQGFASALPYLLKDEYRMLSSHYLRDSELVRDNVLRPESIARLLAEHASGRRDHGNRLWLLINAELWYRMNLKGLSRQDLRDELTELRGGNERTSSRLNVDQLAAA